MFDKQRAWLKNQWHQLTGVHMTQTNDPNETQQEREDRERREQQEREQQEQREREGQQGGSDSTADTNADVALGRNQGNDESSSTS